MSLERLDRYEVAIPMTAVSMNLRRFGVPMGGPMDAESFQIAHGTTWELFGIAVSQWRVVNSGFVSISGMPRRLSLNEIPVDAPAKVETGDILRIEPIIGGQIAYLSHCLTSKGKVPSPAQAKTLRIWPSVDGLDQSELFDRDFHLSIESSRIGFRVTECITGVKDLPTSEPTGPGVVQLTPDGKLIILGPDGPTIGGYTRIAAIVEEDLKLLGRIGFGQPFRFLPR